MKKGNKAEQLGNLRYSAFIRDFFMDMSAPIAATRGEVYQCVGNEVVVTWEWKPGLQHARCLRCFFGMQQAVERRWAYYPREYGVVPTFKAGLHGGPVVATQVGDIKTELVFHGDVLNTTARIQAQCNALQSRLPVSATVLEALRLGPAYQARPLGTFTLRGKNQQVELFDVQLAAAGVVAENTVLR
jgi:adenylate cyclase